MLLQGIFNNSVTGWEGDTETYERSSVIEADLHTEQTRKTHFSHCRLSKANLGSILQTRHIMRLYCIIKWSCAISIKVHISVYVKLLFQTFSRYYIHYYFINNSKINCLFMTGSALAVFLSRSVTSFYYYLIYAHSKSNNICCHGCLMVNHCPCLGINFNPSVCVAAIIQSNSSYCCLSYLSILSCKMILCWGVTAEAVVGWIWPPNHIFPWPWHNFWSVPSHTKSDYIHSFDL